MLSFSIIFTYITDNYEGCRLRQVRLCECHCWGQKRLSAVAFSCDCDIATVPVLFRQASFSDTRPMCVIYTRCCGLRGVSSSTQETPCCSKYTMIRAKGLYWLLDPTEQTPRPLFFLVFITGGEQWILLRYR